MAILDRVFSVFGNKSRRDIKRLWPRVEAINARSKVLEGYSDDSLRAETPRLRGLLEAGLEKEDARLSSHEARSQDPSLGLEEKESLFALIDEMKVKRYKELERVLDEILEEAFAVMKETARRLATRGFLRVKATEADRVLALGADYVRIEKDEAVWLNRWSVAGKEMEWTMVHYDVQLLGGIILHEGKVAEMATGEGKTLVATLPAYLNALCGEGVHIVTVNDYLARRDLEWNAPLFRFHLLRTDCVDKYEPHSEERREAYRSDIIYGTNNEFGFDYLRDNMVHRQADLVQRAHYFAMVDEVDSVLIDEARTPLIISGPVDSQNDGLYVELRSKVLRLMDAQKKLCMELLQEAKKHISAQNHKEGGLALMRAHRGLPKYKPLIRYLSEGGIKQVLQRTENVYLQENMRLMPEADQALYFVIDEKNHNIELTDKGIDLLQASGSGQFVLPNLGEELTKIAQDEALTAGEDRMRRKEALMQEFRDNSERIHVMNQLLRAYALYERDTEYVVMDKRVKIVDEQTGRILEGRRYSDGLHQAIEAKEGVKVEQSSQTYATITLQNYFRMYKKLSGMTGTAETEASELWDIYKLDVTVIPTHKPVIRTDSHDRVYKTVGEKFKAMIDEIASMREKGRPTLVGTTSVEISELLSRMLKMRGVPHDVLNAKQHQREADIIARAGEGGQVTIATNMAGRGTDIKLSTASKNAGGLCILGSERHESRRVDRQLRGRSGRQGDPGSSVFFVSLEDNLMRLFGSDRAAKWMDRLGIKEGELIQSGLITRSIERAQKKVEQNYFSIRKRLLEYDNVMNAQRTVIYAYRRHALFGERLRSDIAHMFLSVSRWLAQTVKEKENTADFSTSMQETLGMALTFTPKEWSERDSMDAERFHKVIKAHYEKRKGDIVGKDYACA